MILRPRYVLLLAGVFSTTTLAAAGKATDPVSRAVEAWAARPRSRS